MMNQVRFSHSGFLQPAKHPVTYSRKPAITHHPAILSQVSPRFSSVKGRVATAIGVIAASLGVGTLGVQNYQQGQQIDRLEKRIASVHNVNSGLSGQVATQRQQLEHTHNTIEKLETRIKGLQEQQDTTGKMLGQISAFADRLQADGKARNAQLAQLAKGLEQVKSQPGTLQKLAQVTQTLRKNIFLVNVTKPGTPHMGFGTAFAVADRKGDVYVVTNAHVVGSRPGEKSVLEGIAGKRYTLKDSSGKTYNAEVFAVSPPYAGADIAILKVASDAAKSIKEGGHILELRDFAKEPLDNNSIGKFFVTTGNPYGFERSSAFGMMSSCAPKNMSILYPKEDSVLGPVIQMYMDINPGNSGGPLADENGKVAGMAYGIAEDADSVAWFVHGRNIKAFMESVGIPIASPEELKSGAVDVKGFRNAQAAAKERYTQYRLRKEAVKTIIRDMNPGFENFLGTMLRKNLDFVADQIDDRFARVLKEQNVDLSKVKDPLKDIPEAKLNIIRQAIRDEILAQSGIDIQPSGGGGPAPGGPGGMPAPPNPAPPPPHDGLLPIED